MTSTNFPYIREQVDNDLIDKEPKKHPDVIDPTEAPVSDPDSPDVIDPTLPPTREPQPPAPDPDPELPPIPGPRDPELPPFPMEAC